jgi:hypothetical protein
MDLFLCPKRDDDLKSFMEICLTKLKRKGNTKWKITN